MDGWVMAALLLPVIGLMTLGCLERLTGDTLTGVRVVVLLATIVTFLDDVMPEPVVGSFTVTPADAAFGVIAVSAVARCLRARRLAAAQRGLVVLAALVVLSLLRGIPEYGLQTAINESRTFLYFVFGALYFSLSAPTPELRRAAGRWWLYGVVAIVCIVVLRWAVVVAGLPPTGVMGRAAEAGSIRVIDNRATLQLAWALFMLVPLATAGRLSKTWHRVLFGALIVMLVLLNHRTIWVTLLAGGVVVAARTPGLGRRIVGALAVTAVLASVVIVGLENLEQSPLPQDPLSTETLLWRYEGWRGLIASSTTGSVDVLFGRPLGAGFSREVFGYTVDVAPHNWYLQIYLRTGLLGLAAFALTMVGGVLALWRRRPEDPSLLFSAQALLVGMVLQTVYFLTWPPSLAHGLAVGIAVSLAASTQHPVPTWNRGRRDPTPVLHLDEPRLREV